MIDKVGLLLIRDNALLLCRKARGTQLLILPGGKREPGETSLECLAREVHEELGDVEAIDPEFIGVYQHVAAGEAGKQVRIELYRAELTGEPCAQAEIAELVWFSPLEDWCTVSPSIAEKILPDLIARGILST